MKKILFFIAVILLLLTSFPFSAHAVIRTVTGTVTKVSDGDTIQITTPEQTKLKVRLYGIDAPETTKINKRTGQISKPGQPYGKESWQALRNKIMGKQVKAEIIELDKYRRAVCMIWLNDRNINLEMIRDGYAEAFIEYLRFPYKPEFLEAEKKARSAKIGIWSLPYYERPREFRKRMKISDGH